MKVTFAQFNVEHGGKSYGVQMGVQCVAHNQTFTTVTIYAVNDSGLKRIISSFSAHGRQTISPSNAKKFLRSALIAEGVIKERQHKETPPAITGAAPLFDLKATPGAEINDQRKTWDTLIEGIKRFLS